VLVHEIIGFSVTGEMDFMAVLFQVVTEMNAAGCMPQTLPANDKQNTHTKIPEPV
jgi:hypothetical protein